MSSLASAWRSFSVAMGVTVLGLVALAVGALGGVGFGALGVALLCVGGWLAGTARWKLARTGMDSEAHAYLAVAYTELEDGNPMAAAKAASKAASVAQRSQTRNRALTTLAWAALAQGYPERAKAALDRVAPSHAIDVYCLAAVEAARGRMELAIQALEVARTAGSLTCEGAKLLVECHLREFGIERAVLIALQTRQALGQDNCERVVDAARLAGAHAVATMLARTLGNDPTGASPPSTRPTLGSASAG